jgi:hypothetical protein
VDPDEFIPFDPEDQLEGCIEALDFEPEPAPEGEESEEQ